MPRLLHYDGDRLVAAGLWVGFALFTMLSIYTLIAG